MASVKSGNDHREVPSWLVDGRVWLLVLLLVTLFGLDVALPEVVLLPFMYVPVVAAATFAGPRTTKSGQYRWVSVALRPFVDQADQIVGQVATLRDIHEDVLLREALARNERTFRLAMDGAAQGMAVVGLHHRLLKVNDALGALVTRDKSWLTQHDEDELLHEDDVEPTRQVRDRLLTGHADHETRASRLITSDGATVWITHGMGLLRDDDGVPLFFVCQYTASPQHPHLGPPGP
jgi:PAS domain S-box-containing protein